MQELEKILEEINRRINEYVDHDYVRGSGDVVKGLSIAKSIVRKHLSRENTTEITRCSRDTQGAEHEINLPKEEFEMLRFSDSVTFRCGNEYVSLYMGWDEATREYKNMNDGWIPVEERLPEKYISVLVQWEKYDRSIDETLIYLDVMWLEDEEDVVFETINGIPNGRVIAWCPLPEPYRPERSEGE